MPAQLFMVQIMQKLNTAATQSNVLRNLAYGAAFSKLNGNKRALLRNFRDHPVTKEILAGPTASTVYLPVGNLNSFIGFYDGQAREHVDLIEAIFVSEIRVIKGSATIQRDQTSARFSFNVQSPSLLRIWAATPYPQGRQNVSRGGSWAQDLEAHGIDGLEFYIYQDGRNTSQNSRSLEARQVPERPGKERKPVGGGSMPAIPYIEMLMTNFVSKMQYAIT